MTSLVCPGLSVIILHNRQSDLLGPVSNVLVRIVDQVGQQRGEGPQQQSGQELDQQWTLHKGTAWSAPAHTHTHTHTHKHTHTHTHT